MQYFSLRLEKEKSLSNTTFIQHCTGILGQYINERKIKLSHKDYKLEIKLISNDMILTIENLKDSTL